MGCLSPLLGRSVNGVLQESRRGSRCSIGSTEFEDDVEPEVFGVGEGHMPGASYVEPKREGFRGGAFVEAEFDEHAAEAIATAGEKGVRPANRALEPRATKRSSGMFGSSPCTHRRDGFFRALPRTKSLGLLNDQKHTRKLESKGRGVLHGFVAASFEDRPRAPPMNERKSRVCAFLDERLVVEKCVCIAALEAVAGLGYANTKGAQGASWQVDRKPACMRTLGRNRGMHFHAGPDGGSCREQFDPGVSGRRFRVHALGNAQAFDFVYSGLVQRFASPPAFEDRRVPFDAKRQ
jgi:hypothetical protein